MANTSDDVEFVGFTDRTAAGELLADTLLEYEGKDCVVYAVPRGGVVVGAVVARRLLAPLDLIIPRKIGHPYQPEYAVAAVTEDGSVVGSNLDLGTLDPQWLDAELQRQRAEAARRREVYLEGRSSPDVSGKTAIIVDDGIATGFTMQAAIHDVSKRHPGRIIVAVPVAPKDIVRSLQREVDEVVALIVPDEFAGGVGVYYQDFEQVDDEDVKRRLQEA